jgi:nitrite reductase/ring-hydroxylating ferredoxin subunit
MLSRENNEMLTRVGPGTPMGDVLRRYWTPACLSAEIPETDGPPVRVRLFGENLVAFRNSEGKVGLLAEGCPHRRASLYYGRNEDNGLRCVYHGWKFGVDGTCVDMPNERASFAQKVSARSYPTHESGGVIWAYLGPAEHMPPFRDFGTESLPPGRRLLVHKQYSSCNWVQALEGNIDSAHVSYLHMHFGDEPDDGTDKPGVPSDSMVWRALRHDGSPRIEVDDKFHGFTAAGLRNTPNGYSHVRVTSYIVPFYVLGPRVPFNTVMAATVPIDDESCWRYHITTQVDPRTRAIGTGEDFFDFATYESDYYADGIVPREWTADNEYGMSREAQRTTSFTGVPEFMTQDIMITESMGPICDRTQEHLGSSDRAITRMRTMLLKAAKDLDAGIEPPGTGPDPRYLSVRGAERILDTDEDWRHLGTDTDPIVAESLAIRD